MTHGKETQLTRLLEEQSLTQNLFLLPGGRAPLLDPQQPAMGSASLQGHDNAASQPLLQKPLETGGDTRNPSPSPALKLMEGPEYPGDHDHDFVDFAETFLSSEAFAERPQEGKQPGTEQQFRFPAELCCFDIVSMT